MTDSAPRPEDDDNEDLLVDEDQLLDDAAGALGGSILDDPDHLADQIPDGPETV